MAQSPPGTTPLSHGYQPFLERRHHRTLFCSRPARRAYPTNVAGLDSTNITFALTNSTAGVFSVKLNTNLADWQFLGPATPRYGFSDTNAPATSQRSYRLRWP